jgi:hypothetical protein
MDHRERILAAISHRPLDRVPTDMWATAEVQEKLFAHFGIDTARDTCPGGSVAAGGISLGGGLLTRDVSAILELWDRTCALTSGGWGGAARVTRAGNTVSR